MERPILRLAGVCREYRMGPNIVHALRKIDLEIFEGEFVSIVGRSGSGKSSLLNIIGFLDTPTEGEVYLEGADVSALNADQRAVIRNEKIGFVFQSFNLLARASARENVEVPLIYRGTPKASRRRRVEVALSAVGLSDRGTHTARQLSGGEQQRVAMARALVADPRIILADEPTGALDTRTAQTVIGMLQDLNRSGLTVVLVTHDQDLAAIAQRTVTLRDGLIISDTRNETSGRRSAAKDHPTHVEAGAAAFDDPASGTGHRGQGDASGSRSDRLDESAPSSNVPLRLRNPTLPPVTDGPLLTRAPAEKQNQTAARHARVRPSAKGIGVLAGFRIALAALWSAKLRSSLTALGIVIGVAAVITMVAVGRGAQVEVEQQISSLGANILFINAVPKSDGLRSDRVVPLTEVDAVAIARDLPGVDVAAAVVSGSLRAVNGNRNRLVNVQGITLDYLFTREWGVASGRVFTSEEFRTPSKVGLLGQTTATRLFGADEAVGSTLRLNRTSIRVVGILEQKGQSPSGYDQDDVILVPMPTAKLRLLGRQFRANPRAVQYILAKVSTDEYLEQASEDIKTLLIGRKRRPSANYDVDSLSAIFVTKEETSRSIAILLAAVASVSLVVGGISIMNIMLVSVTERTREIGVRLALGARPQDIRSQFLIEAVTLALVGGALGILIGVGAATGIGLLAGWPIIIEPFAVAMSAAFSGLVGIVFGYFPARRASRLDPIEALRME